ncbi:M23 family metallopeptidase [Paenibacillus beijingensis]|uniref:Peptidase M23 n=1 Tax=Paenibacillus beijingensis TaxID=1126833 RepID=A0A0D5NFV0_9BACL|nr:M23 family metallopeptidase [Paenibacillus beijingensis]AJY73788.1 peptidase M23 [Paenibacillus beijingensis]
MLRKYPAAAALLSVTVSWLVFSAAGGAAIAQASGAESGTKSQTHGTEDGGLHERRLEYDRMALLTGFAWYQLAAIDQYERTLSDAKPKERPKLGQWAGVYISEEKWAGELNPDKGDSNPKSIRVFNGIGRDGDGDGKAERTNDADLLYSEAAALLRYGSSQEDFAIGLWEYYHNIRSVQRVKQFAKLYETFDRLDLFQGSFPLPVKSQYSYRSTWGTARSWGGYRIHEGTDIFAHHGLPVRSTVYGIVEIKGWNAYGGWRIGIRDLNNRYHYYAHLSGFEKKLEAGDVVTPGQTIGWVGSSGYGKPGTQGKFPPHLHYGIYRDRGWVEWAFDPYPLLHRWEREELQRLRSAKRNP